jgi:hypothetical protein
MQEYKFIDGLSGSFLSGETRRYLALEKLSLTVSLHGEQAAKERELALRRLQEKKLIQEWGFDPLELEFLSDETISFILYRAETLYEHG